MVHTSENPLRDHYLHAPEQIKEHRDDLVDQARNPLAEEKTTGEQTIPKQGVIFESNHVRLLLEAIGDPNHPLRQQAEQAVGGFAQVAVQLGQGTSESLAREIKVPPEFQVVSTINQAAALAGVPPEELVTVKDIRREWNLKGSRIHDWTRHGRHGQPNLTPLDVRLKGATGSAQKLFRRGDVERVVANPPKPGRPWK